MKHLFVPYELALKLKEKGFDEDTWANYYDEIEVGAVIDITKEHHPVICSAPLYQQVIDWFREKHEIDIWVERNGGMEIDHRGYLKFYYPCVWNLTPTHQKVKYDYYEALNKAIEEALKLI